MKFRYGYPLVSAALLAAVGCGAYASPALASPARPTTHVALPAKLPPAPAQFRSSYERMLKNLGQVSRRHAAFDSHFGLSNAADQSLKATAALTPDQLAAVYYAVSQIPNWQSLPSLVSTAGFGGHVNKFATGDGCPADVSDASLIAANSTRLAADFALEILPDSVVAGGGLIVAGEGAVVVATSPASPLRIPVKAVTTAADAAGYQLELTRTAHDSCVTDQHDALLDTVSANLASDTTDIKNTVNTTATAIQTALATSTKAIQDNITASTKAIQDSLAAGFAQINAKITGVSGQVSNAQGTLDTKIEQRQVHLDARSLTNGQRLLLSVTESGQPVNATLVSIKSANSSASTLAFTDVTSSVTSSALGSGLVQVSFPSSQPSTTIYQIVVKDDGSSGAVHYGTLLFSR